MEPNENENKQVVVIEDINRPMEVVNYGKKSAEVLKDIVRQANLIKKLGKNEYMMFEGWQTVAKFFNATVGIEWTKPVLAGEKIEGFEAKAYVKDKDGNIISTAESYCGRDEDNWKERPIYAIRSMAQTRACAKVLRQVYSWVVVLAGYKPTPLEEMDGVVIKEPAKPIPKKVVSPMPAKQEKSNDPEMKCHKCGVELTEKVYKFSMDKYQTPLCFKHQKELQEELQREEELEEIEEEIY